MTKRCPFKVGQTLATNTLRELLPPVLRSQLPRGPFVITEIVKTRHSNGGYITTANAAKRGVVITWLTFFPRFGKKGGRGSGVRPYLCSLRVDDPEQHAKWEAECKAREGGSRSKKPKSGVKSAIRDTAPLLTESEMDAEERGMMGKTMTQKNYLTLAQFDGEEL